MRSPPSGVPPRLPGAGSGIGPIGQEPVTPLPLPPTGTRAQSLTHHPLLGRCVIPDHQHHRAAADTEEKGCLAWAPERGLHRPGRLEGAGHLPERLGVGHCSRPVNVQVSAAAGRGGGEHPRTGSRGGALGNVPKPDTAVFQPRPSTWQLWPNSPGGAGLAPDWGLTL